VVKLKASSIGVKSSEQNLSPLNASVVGSIVPSVSRPQRCQEMITLTEGHRRNGLLC